MAAAHDVVVIGAGPSGSLAAERLIARGLRVLLLEAGPRIESGRRPREPDRRAWAHTRVGRPFDWYRVHAVGGRTHLWGGWAHRFPDAVLRRAGFPYGAAEIAPYYDEAERLLGVRDEPLDQGHAAAAAALGLAIEPKRTALGRHDDVWTPRGRLGERRARTQVVALELVGARHRVDAVRALDLRTLRTRTFATRAVVLAASPIETARLLLASGFGRRIPRLGRGLVDHLVASWVLLEPAPPPEPRPGERFAPSSLISGPALARFAPEADLPAGFCIEITGPVPLPALELDRFVPEDELAHWRATQFHALGESFPNGRRRVDLDPVVRDTYDRRAPRIHMAWSHDDHRLAAVMRHAGPTVADALAIPGSRLIRFRDPEVAGAGHEAGTCAMGADQRTPLDAWGHVRTLANVWVADASALPTAGDRHPTLTVVAHALRTADDVLRQLSSVVG